MLYEQLQQVSDQSTFFVFVQQLIEDNQQNIDGWENSSIGAFLEAAVAWAIDSDLSAQPSWRAFAEFLYAGRSYE